jgi:hypothetical protein
MVLAGHHRRRAPTEPSGDSGQQLDEAGRGRTWERHSRSAGRGLPDDRYHVPAWVGRPGGSPARPAGARPEAARGPIVAPGTTLNLRAVPRSRLQPAPTPPAMPFSTTRTGARWRSSRPPRPLPRTRPLGRPMFIQPGGQHTARIWLQVVVVRQGAGADAGVPPSLRGRAARASDRTGPIETGAPHVGAWARRWLRHWRMPPPSFGMASIRRSAPVTTIAER